MTTSRATRITSLLVALAFVFAGCLEDTILDSTPPTPSDTTWSEGMTGPATSGTVRLSGRLALARSGDQPLTNAVVCVDDRNDIACTATNTQGIFTLDELPQEQDLILSIDTNNGSIFPTLLMYRTRDQNEAFQTTPLTRSFTRDFELRFTEDTRADRGHVILETFNAREVGAEPVTNFTATLQAYPSINVLYATNFANSDNVRFEANDTTSQVAFFNVLPGTFDITLTHPTMTCNPWWGLTSSADDTVRVTVEADHVTRVAVVCQ